MANSDLMMRITDKEFQAIQNLVYERFAITLTDQKRGLVVSRLQKVLRQHGFTTFSQYTDYMVSEKSGQAIVDFVNRITTNYSYFYREKAHFDFFVQTALPQAIEAMKKENSRDLRIWCAGCSTGEEPYMLVMLMLNFFANEYGLWDAGILATDISNRALDEALEATYPDERVNKVPPAIRNKYFTKEKEGRWRVVERVKKEVTFRRFNLKNEQFPFRRPFHMIFCRNVMIYFNGETREELVRKFFQSTKPGGCLFIGHSESLHRETCPYKYLMPALYQRADG